MFESGCYPFLSGMACQLQDDEHMERGYFLLVCKRDRVFKTGEITWFGEAYRRTSKKQVVS